MGRFGHIGSDVRYRGPAFSSSGPRIEFTLTWAPRSDYRGSAARRFHGTKTVGQCLWRHAEHFKVPGGVDETSVLQAENAVGIDGEADPQEFRNSAGREQEPDWNRYEDAFFPEMRRDGFID